jgi:hypothetical protein
MMAPVPSSFRADSRRRRRLGMDARSDVPARTDDSDPHSPFSFNSIEGQNGQGRFFKPGEPQISAASHS